jgi:hypothetical protein
MYPFGSLRLHTLLTKLAKEAPASSSRPTAPDRPQPPAVLPAHPLVPAPARDVARAGTGSAVERRGSGSGASIGTSADPLAKVGAPEILGQYQLRHGALLFARFLPFQFVTGPLGLPFGLSACLSVCVRACVLACVCSPA